MSAKPWDQGEGIRRPLGVLLDRKVLRREQGVPIRSVETAGVTNAVGVFILACGRGRGGDGKEEDQGGHEPWCAGGARKGEGG